MLGLHGLTWVLQPGGVPDARLAGGTGSLWQGVGWAASALGPQQVLPCMGEGGRHVHEGVLQLLHASVGSLEQPCSFCRAFLCGAEAAHSHED